MFCESFDVPILYATLNTKAGSMLARSALTRRHAMEGSYGQWPRSEMKMLQVIEDNKSILCRITDEKG